MRLYVNMYIVFMHIQEQHDSSSGVQYVVLHFSRFNLGAVVLNGIIEATFGDSRLKYSTGTKDKLNMDDISLMNIRYIMKILSLH